MSIHCPETEEELIAYTKRKLGEDMACKDETLEVDITDNQCKDLVEDTLQMWKMYSYDGCKEVFYIIPTKTGQTQYQLPSNTFAVHGYLPINEYYNMFSLDYQMKTYMGMNLRNLFDITTIQITKEWLALLDLKLGKKYMYEFNSASKMLNIYAGAKTGTTIVVTASQFIDDVPNVYNEIWVKRYLEALFLKQWGYNFRQFDGVKLPSGITINWRDMIGDANQRIEKLEEELVTHYSRPVCMQRG